MAVYDTSALIDLFLRPRSPRRERVRAVVRRHLELDEPLCTTRFNMAELYAGVEQSTNREAQAGMVDRIGTVFQVLEFDDAAARRFGLTEARLRRAGTPIERMDVMIGAVAASAGMTLVTANPRDFIRITDLAVESY